VLRTRSAEIAILGLLAAYNGAVRSAIPRRARIPANLAVAGTGVALAALAGTTLPELGLERAAVRRGLDAGAAAAAPIVVTVGAAVIAPRLRAVIADEYITTTTRSEAIFEALVRIPFETALAEELMFRGALLGLALHARSVPAALARSSMWFGLWHAYPTVESLLRGTGGDRFGNGSRRLAASTAGVVAATTAAGVGLSLLRLRSGSLVAPVLAHAAINMTAFVGVRVGSGRP